MSTTSTWVSSGSPRAGSWRDAYGGWRTDGTDVYQGDYGWGHHRGLWYFNDASIRSTLSGRRILSVEIEIQRRNTSHGSTAAGTPTMRLHNYSSQPSGTPTMGSGRSSHGKSFTRGSKQWVPLFNSWGDALRDNTAKGIGVYTTSNTPYLVFEPVATLKIVHEPLLSAPPTPTGFTLTGSTTSSVGMSCNTAGSSASNNLASSYRWDREGGGTATTTGTSFSNTGLSAGLTDRWRVRAENSAGVSSYTGWLTGRTKPATPGNLRQTGATTTSITASWNSVTGATLYRLDPLGLDTSTSTGITQTRSSLSPGTTYSLRIRAENPIINSTGGAGSYSSYVSMTTLPVAPNAPIASSITHTAVSLSWNSVTGATSYEVQRQTNGGAWSTVRTQSGTSWTSTGLSPDTSYGYRVRAISGGGAGDYSGITTISTVPLPLTPTGLASSGVQGYQATLTWDDMSASGAVSYTLQRLSSTGSLQTSWQTASLTITDTSILPGGGYQYRVRSESSLGGSSEYSAIVTVNATPLPQKAPSLQEQPNYNSVEERTFFYTFETDNINDAQTAYQVEIRRVSDDVAVFTPSGIVYSGTNDSFFVPGGTLANDVDYKWRVRTKDNFAEGIYGPWSEYSTFSTITPPTVFISAPLDNDSFSLSTDPDVLVTWLYSQVGSRPQSAYQVIVRDFTTKAIILNTGWVFSSVASHTINGLTQGTYDIEVRVHSGGVESAPDEVVNIGIATNTITLAGDTALVEWSPTAGVDGGPGFVFKDSLAANFVQYHITPNTGGWSTVARSFELGVELWQSRKEVEYPSGTNIMLTVISNIEHVPLADTDCRFNIEFEYEDDTIEASYSMDMYDDATLRTPIGGGFYRFTTSLLAKKPVKAILLEAMLEVNHETLPYEYVIDSLSMSRAGRLYSQEYLDTESKRGLLLTGSGYIQGTELRVSNSSGLDEGLRIFDDTISTTGDLTLAPGVGSVRIEAGVNGPIPFVFARTSTNEDLSGEYSPTMAFGGLAWVRDGAASATAPIAIARDGTVGIGTGAAATHDSVLKVGGQTTIDSPTYRNHLRLHRDGQQVDLSPSSATTLGITPTTDGVRFVDRNGAGMAVIANNGIGSAGRVQAATGANGGFRVGTEDHGTVANNTATGGAAFAYDSEIMAIRRNSVALVINRSTSLTSSTAMLSLRYRGSQVGSIGISSTATAFNTTSDARLKKGERRLEGARGRIGRLNVYRHAWKDDPNEELHDGLFAQEAAEHFPDAVTPGGPSDDGTGGESPWMVDYSKFVPALLAAVQELSDENEAQQARIDDLEARLTALEA